MRLRRLTTGFHRLGVVLAAPFLIAAVASIGVFLVLEPGPRYLTDAEFLGLGAPVAGATSQPNTEAEVFGSPRAAAVDTGPNDWVVPAQGKRDRTPLVFAAGSLVIGGFLYGLCVSIAWIWVGFSKQQEG